MVLKLLVFMVAVAVLEGVAGLQEEQFANETQIEANPDHKRKGGRLDKLPCIMEGGTCKPKGEHCDGVVRQGPEWCLHDRHFECCYPYGCWMGEAVCPNGAIAEENCIILICENGCWVYAGWNEDCDVSYTYGDGETNIVPFLCPAYLVPDPGPYRFTGSVSPLPRFGIDINIANSGCIDYILYYEPGVFIYIFPGGMICVQWDWGPCLPFIHVGICKVQPVSTGFGTIYIENNVPGWLYIIGSYGLSVWVNYGLLGIPCLLDVFAIASPSLYGDLDGLGHLSMGSGTTTQTPYTLNYTVTESNGGTNYIANFIEKWKIPVSRSRNNNDIKKLLKDHALQVTDQTIIKKSMSDIVKSCEEMNEGPCSILSSEECKILQETCVSRMSNVSGQGDSSDSSE